MATRAIPLYQNIPPTTQVVASIVLLILATLLSRDTALPSWEINLFNSIHDWPDFLYPLFYAVTQLGSIFMLGGLLAFYFFRNKYHILIRLLMTGTLAYLLAGFVKSVWGRARPHELLDGIVALDYIQGPGFPSGHTALAVALALTIGHYVPRAYHWLIAVWIVGVALSRIYLGVHLPMDIIGGFAIGWFAYAVFRHVRIYDTVLGRKKPKSRSNRSRA